MRPRFSLIILSIAGALAACQAAMSADLKIGVAAPVTSIDPHYFNAAPNNSIARHIFNQLTDRAPDAKLTPGLALSWTPLTDMLWEFRLRPGVTWQDGTPFTADDVGFTMSRVPKVPNSPGGFAGSLRGIIRVELVDPLTVRFHTAAPVPNLPLNMSRIEVISRHAGENASTEDYNSGKAAVGTGAYKLIRFVPGDRVELERNPYFWGTKPAWEHVTFYFISNPASRVAALLAGDVDLIDYPPPNDLAGLAANPKLSVASIPSLRAIYVCPDYSRSGEEPFISDKSGAKLHQNPLLDRRIRQALSISIDRASISTNVMQGSAIPTGQWLPAGAFGFAPQVQVPLFDPEHAKALLKEAGYPDGFNLILHTPNDRYPNDAATALAVAAMWSRIGVRTTVEALPWSLFSARGSHQEFSMGLWGWGSGSGEAGDVLLNVLGTYDPAASRGTNNHCRYSNKALDDLTDRALGTLAPDVREAAEREAVALAMDDDAIIPVYQLVNSWVTKRGLALSPRMDDFTLATGVAPAR